MVNLRSRRGRRGAAAAIALAALAVGGGVQNVDDLAPTKEVSL
ncbi:hypothetical protein TSHO111613_17030 [Tsukamurella hominis]